MAKKTKNKVVFDPKKFLSAGAKGSSVVNGLDGAVICISNLVSGNVVDWQTFKKHKTYYEEKKVKFHEYSEFRIEPVCEHFAVCGVFKCQNMQCNEQLHCKPYEV